MEKKNKYLKRSLQQLKIMDKKIESFNPETVKAQEQFTNQIRQFILQNETKKLAGKANHEHRCLFEMIDNDKGRQLSNCKWWRRDHNNTIPFNGHIGWSDACDCCDMMCYVALDDEGKLMYAIR